MSKPKRNRPRRRLGPTPRKRIDTTSSPAPPVGARTATPTASARYTPRNRGAFRPGWHKLVGAAIIVAGVAIFVLNDVAWFGPKVLPGAHNELYAIVAFVVALPGTWWFGWFDPAEGRW